MNKFKNILVELKDLQEKLKQTADRLFSIKMSLASIATNAPDQNIEMDFLPRKLERHEKDEQVEIEKILNRLNRIISQHLDSSMMAFGSLEDAETVSSISRMIRYIHNTFGGDLPLGITSHPALPAFSKN